MLAFVGVIDYFRILKALIIFFFFFMNNVSNQNGEVLEEKLAGSNSDVMKISLRGQRYIKLILPVFQVLEKPLSIHFPFCHI